MTAVASGPRRVAITGATGMIGSALVRVLKENGDQPVPVSRQRLSGGLHWDPLGEGLHPRDWEGFDAVIHLAGENIAASRWTPQRKQELINSRVLTTSRLAEVLAELASPPELLISASAIGYYGNRGEEILTESAPSGKDFTSGLGRQWEAAADPARAAGLRVVHPRFGVILDRDSGALPRMVMPMQFGAGGRLGSGRQWMSWITLADVIGVILRILDDQSIRGPVNVVAPEPVRNADFTRTLARVLHRPAVMAAPAFMLRLALGELADSLLLTSERVVPEVLQQAGYQYQYPELQGALEALLLRRK